ncbi:site-specific DNA-methyltransferase [Thermincola ferriacetica]
MDRLKMKSVDLTQDNIDKIAQLFPNVITEVRDETGRLRKAVDFDLLRQELSADLVEGDKERYQLTWPGKKQAILLANTPINKTLRPVKEDSVDWDNTQNLYIEGDNLEVLKLLQESYLNKVKCIYIDPPYNTGKDFIYRDNFRQENGEYLEDSGQVDDEGNRLFQNTESNGRFHSDWLTMMYSRLKLARNLLRDDGVIFISIDDNEVHNLRKICDEIFGGKNLLVSCVWVSGRTSSAHFTNSHEYIVGYAKNLASLPLFKYVGKDETITDRTIKKPSAKNPVSSITFPAGIDFECEDKIFPSKFGDREPVIVENGVFQCENKKLKNPVTLAAAWAMKDMIIKWLNGEEVYDQKGQKVKRFFFKANGVLQYEKERGTVHPNSVIRDITTKNGTNEIVDLLGISVFDFPKPTDLIKYFAPAFGEEAIILDFFAGTSTTAHAVMQLNAEDGGNRKYIMVQLPEPTAENSEAYKAGYKNICEIGKERIRRAARKIKEEANADIDYGFRVFRVDSSNMKDVYYTPDKLKQDSLFALESNIKEDRTGDDLIVQVMLECGLELSLPMEKREIEGCEVHFVAGNSLVACFAEQVPETVIRAIAAAHPLRVVFRDSSFASDADRINVEEIFKMISPGTEIKVL